MSTRWRGTAGLKTYIGETVTPLKLAKMQVSQTKRKKKRKVPVLSMGAIIPDFDWLWRKVTELAPGVSDPAAREVEPFQPWGGRKGVPKGVKEYDNVYVEGGKVWVPQVDGTRRCLGYTPVFAKKKYRVRRRRKRLTKRDMYILSVIEKTGQTSALPLIM